MLAVNLTGPLLGIQTLAPLMERGGSIVNVGSVAALGGYHAVAYTVSKWGLRGLSRVASLELGPRGIRVNTILPGFVETPMTASAPAAFRERERRADAARAHRARPRRSPRSSSTSISDESSFVSGAEIAVDGGQSAHGGAKPFSDAVAAERSATP